jgi:hypothetical protein
MKTTSFVYALNNAGFSASEFFFIVAYCVQKDIEDITAKELPMIIPKWKELMLKRKKELERYGVQYESELDE